MYKQLCTIISFPSAWDCCIQSNGPVDQAGDMPSSYPRTHQEESSSSGWEQFADTAFEHENQESNVPSIVAGQKKGRKGVDNTIAKAILEMVAASKLRADAIKKINGRFSISDCMKGLDELEDLNDEIYFAALDLFNNRIAREELAGKWKDMMQLRELDGQSKETSSCLFDVPINYVRQKKFRKLSEIYLATSNDKLDSTYKAGLEKMNGNGLRSDSRDASQKSRRRGVRTSSRTYRKGSTSKVASDGCCGRCGDDGELIFCNNCPSTFHPACVYAQKKPEGNWYCEACTCQICSDVVVNEDSSGLGKLKCSQCEKRYHKPCLQQRGLIIESASNLWWCSESCKQVYSGLQSRIGGRNHLSDGFYWTLLKCIHSDQKVNALPELLALQAGCNSKLAVALAIMKDCFVPMVDTKTGIDMLQQVVYNRGSQFARLNYCGFYTVVLEQKDIIMATASIRIHGVAIAEMPFIATCSKHRRQGMCRRLVNSIEQMLKCLKVRKLVISAIPEAVKTWTEGFGFEPLEDDEKRAASKINLMVFPEVVYLKKQLCEIDDSEQT